MPRFTVHCCLIALLAGCAAVPPATDGDGCLALAGSVHHQAVSAGVADAQDPVLAGFPHLRSNRLLAALAPRAQGPALAVWRDHLARLGQQGLTLEWRRLDAATQAGIADRAGVTDVPAALTACIASRRAPDLAAAAELRAQSAVPDDYSASLRVLGLYWLTRFPMAAGVHDWQDTVRAGYAAPHAPGAGLHYVTGPGPATSTVASPPRDLLDIPQPQGPQLDALLQRHAPAWSIATRSDDDRPGTPHWPAGADRPEVDVARPTVFHQVSHALFEDRVLLQLSYVLWFPARTATGRLDPYAGHLDGLVWRVTLDIDGEPLLYDSIHPCGCYHLFFPTRRLQLRAEAPDEAEPPLVLPLPDATPLRLHLAARTHYLERVTAATDAITGVRLELQPLDVLRELDADGPPARSLYGPDTLVPGTERLERFWFWPMGIASAGAMRQWGHHATAFIGRRHFDEPGLVGRYFVRAPNPR